MKITETASFLLVCAIIFAQVQVKAQEPAKGFQLSFTEELRFGEEDGDDNYLWSGLQNRILPAPDGGMFLFEHDTSRVLLFDQQGRFVKEVTRKGEGPGELQYVNAVSRAASGNIYVLDTPAPGNAISIKRFYPDMSYRDTIGTTHMKQRPSALHITPDEQYMAGLFITFHRPTRGLAHKTGVLRMADAQLVNEFYDALVPLPALSITDQNEWIDILAKGLRERFRQGLVAVGTDGTIYAATSDTYEITMWQPGEAKPFRVIRHKHKPKHFTDADLENLVEQQYSNMDAQARSVISRKTLERGFEQAGLLVHPPVLNLIPLEDKGVIVVRVADTVTRLNCADVFDNQGRFLCNFEMKDAGLSMLTPSHATPFVRVFFHDDKAYTIHTNEEGENTAVRYSYRLAQKKTLIPSAN